MQVSRAIWEAIANLVAADTATLANVAAMKVNLAAANFNPTLDLDVATLTPATFTGSAAKVAGTGAQTVYYDALTGEYTIEILEPAGGWHWQCTVTPGAPETIYGFYVTDNAGTALIGAETFPVPITINHSGQGLDVGAIRLRFRLNSPY